MAKADLEGMMPQIVIMVFLALGRRRSVTQTRAKSFYPRLQARAKSKWRNLDAVRFTAGIAGLGTTSSDSSGFSWHCFKCQKRSPPV
jgi:hypothetical protein